MAGAGGFARAPRRITVRGHSSVVNPDSQKITYAYDAAGNRDYLIDPDGGRFTYTYDAAARLTRLVNPQGDRTTFSYDDADRKTAGRLANGARTSFVYDDAGRITGVTHLKSDDVVIAGFDYACDKAGNRTHVVEASGDWVTWSYDPTYQLTNEKRSGASGYNVTYTYDSVGNRLTRDDGSDVTKRCRSGFYLRDETQSAKRPAQPDFLDSPNLRVV